MNIFILEDSEERINFFKEKLKNHTLYIYYDNTDLAKNFIKENKMDMLFLDHDLDGLHHVPSSEENTGYQFVKYLVENNLQKESAITIHSMDTPGANKMLNLLKDNGYKVNWIPFYLLKEGE